MKKIICFLVMLVMVCTMFGTVAFAEDASKDDESKVLVVAFSPSGRTLDVAEKIASIEGGDLYEIIPAEPYTEEDLDWEDSNNRIAKEQNDKSARPEIGSEEIDLSGYSKIYIGYPIWWEEEPRIIDTFVEKYDFGSASMIPFCTSKHSDIGESGKNLAALAGSGVWLDGARFSADVSEEELQNWIEGYKNNTKTFQVGNSSYTIEIPASFGDGGLSEEDIKNSMVAYMYSPIYPVDFCVYQFSKEGLPEDLAELATKEAEQYNTTEIKTDLIVNDINVPCVKAIEQFEGKDYDTITYYLDGGDTYLEVEFWLFGDTAEEDAEKMFSTLAVVEK